MIQHITQNDRNTDTAQAKALDRSENDKQK